MKELATLANALDEIDFEKTFGEKDVSVQTIRSLISHPSFAISANTRLHALHLLTNKKLSEHTGSDLLNRLRMRLYTAAITPASAA